MPILASNTFLTYAIFIRRPFIQSIQKFWFKLVTQLHFLNVTKGNEAKKDRAAWKKTRADRPSKPV